MSINASSLHTRCVMNSNALFGCAITSQGLVNISDPDAAARLFICISVHVHLAKLSTAEEAIGFSPLFFVRLFFGWDRGYMIKLGLGNRLFCLLWLIGTNIKSWPIFRKQQTVWFCFPFENAFSFRESIFFLNKMSFYDVWFYRLTKHGWGFLQLRV